MPSQLFYAYLAVGVVLLVYILTVPGRRGRKLPPGKWTVHIGHRFVKLLLYLEHKVTDRRDADISVQDHQRFH